MRKKVAIIIPTKNRSDYLIELLNYYANVKSEHTIYIGDASDSKHLAKTIPVVDSLGSRINIVHKQYPELNRGAIDNQATVQKMFEFVKEEYIVYSGDDDYFIPQALDKCVEYLEKAPGYSCAHGFGCFVSYNESKGASIINGRYNINDYEGDSGSERFKTLMSSFTVLLYSVHRKEIFMKAYRKIELLTDTMFIELMPVGLSSILGKSKKLNKLYLVRGHHEAKDKQQEQMMSICDPEWFQSLQVYLNTLSEEIEMVDGIDAKDAMQIVKQGFSIYLTREIIETYCKRDVSSSARNIIELVLQRVKMSVPSFIKDFVKNNILSFNYDQKSYDIFINTPGRLSKPSPYNLEFISVLSAFNRISRKNQKMVDYTKSHSSVNSDGKI